MEEKKFKIEIDVKELLRTLIREKKSFLVYSLISAIIAVIVAFSIPRIYNSSVLLAPETSGSSFTSNISSLAAMVGMDVGTNMTGDAIYPEIYPDLMESMDFLVGLFDIHIKTQDGKVSTTYSNYLEKYQKSPWWTYPGEAIKRLFRGKQQLTNKSVNAFKPTRQQWEMAMAISKNIMCTVDKKTSVISIQVTDQDPLVAATIADSVKDKLQVFITDYRTKKARNDLQYMLKLFAESKEQYTKARQRYGAYSDANQDLVLESYRSKQEDLENEMQMQYNIYTQVAQQLQMAKAKLQERTPAFTVVQSAFVPVRHSNTPKIFILFIFLLLGVALRTILLLVKHHKSIILIH